MMDKIEFLLDGKVVSAERGRTILSVAGENGVKIPSLCFDARVSKNTSCFVCVVKDKKTGKFLPSCSACPAPGQDIDASSPEVQAMRRTALNLLLSEHTGDCEAPCTLACPAHASVEEYVREIKNGNYVEGLKIVKERIPMPMSVGRVCPRFCEKDCRRNVYGEAVAINDFKRLAADKVFDEYMEEKAPSTGKKVAIVGGGPAGLSAAYYLVLKGVDVTVFEAMDKAGGMVRYGIPEYRLPKSIVDREIAHFAKLGIRFEYGRKLGENLSLEDLQKNFDAVGLAIGCWKASGMRVEGEELATQGIDFLREVALRGWKRGDKAIGKVIVVGGGNTAMDCLRTSVRLGSSDVTCFYRRTEDEMPAEKIERKEAREEGVKFEFLVAPVALRKSADGRLALECIRMSLGEPDASGRRKPVPVPGSEFTVAADLVIGAIGQGIRAPKCVTQLGRHGEILTDGKSSKVEGVLFGAGDCVTGPATVVEALAGGRRMALDMLEAVTGEKAPAEHTVFVSRGHWQSLSKKDRVFVDPNISDAGRVQQRLIPLEERKNTFKEVACTFTEQEITEEGKRCIRCSCSDKHDCLLRKHSETCGACPDAIGGEKLPVSYDNSHPVIMRDLGKCVKCGICVKTCKEIVNQTLFSLKKRGFFAYVGTAGDKTLPNSCAECGKCIEACPVGALDWKKKA
ncbi:MAG: FAD-dependent oxidoreductase [Victivallaceae bacterium]|nr:FAD-dependent oxidoreductase [Victivallaceae bacterium]